ncbi:hypothetical protein F4779DRAFT_602144 [Xylariaceae sp. FL0662B]|nr:hypothetical protein F4779DRAFT_602144 [Xylariaceae sp. FL0662B]
MTKVTLFEPRSDTRESTVSASAGSPTPPSSGVFTSSCRDLSWPDATKAGRGRHAVSKDGKRPLVALTNSTSTTSGGAPLFNISSPSSGPSNQHHSASDSNAAPQTLFGRVIPSIERIEIGADDKISEDTATTSSRVMTPSTSLTPPVTDGASTLKEKGKDVVNGGNDPLGSIEAHLENLRLSNTRSSLGLSDILHAIQDVTRGQHSRAGSLPEPSPPASESPTPLRRSANRRRSSSRTKLEVHRVEDERPPDDKFHDPAFQTAFRDARKCMSELADTLAGSPLHHDPDSTMRQLHQRAERLAQFQCPPSLTVGFVGESGAGKSSLLNSLLDRHGLARTSNIGAACTCVATEYHYHNSGEYTIEIEMFTMDELIEQISELLRSYRHFHLHKDSLDHEERKDLGERANVARDSFRAMFRQQLTNENFLIDSPEKTVFQTLKTWAEDTAPLSMNKTNSRPTLNECSTLLMRLTSEDSSEDSSADGPIVWPYIKKIKVYLNAHILSKGLILVDLPGLRDLNSARQHITERYLLKCDEIFVICNEGRATTDVGVKAVFELAKKARLDNVGIICTKSDDIQAEEAKRDWKGQKSKDVQRMIDAVDTAKRDIDNIKTELEGFDTIEDDLTDEEKDEQIQLIRRLRKAEDRRDDHKFKLDHYLIVNRNDIVESKLKTLYRDQVPGGRLKVFCISNSLYWDHRDAPKPRALPRLTLSGILAVREHCMAMVSDSQYLSASNYMNNDISVLLGEVELWVQSGSGSMDAERKQVVREALDTLESRLKRHLSDNSSEINKIAGSFRQKFRADIYGPYRSHITAWSEGASEASYDWSGWHHATYSAFCRNYGNYCTPAVGQRNWNEEIMETMARELSSPWRGLCASLEDRNEHMTILIDDLMDEATELLDVELPDDSDSIATLSTTMSSRQRLLITDIEAACSKFRDSLDTLRTDALSSIRSSFLGKAMEDSYRACIYESGRGSDARRKAIINNAVRRESLFADLLQEFRKSFGELAAEFQESVQDAARTHLDNIRATLDIVRSDNVALESETDPGFRARVEAEVMAAKDEMKRLQRSLS